MIIACSCSPAVTEPPKTAPPAAIEAPLSDREKRIEGAIDLSLDYLVRATGPNGKFAYRINLDPNVDVRDSYNVLRHAGSMYAMAERITERPSPEAAAALGRAARYLEAHIAPLAAEPSLLAVWSTPAHNEAKLGGSGLALVAMSMLARTQRSTVNVAQLKKVLAFIDFLQKDDGSFFSKYYRGTGPDDSWTSLYYPGEAALGAVMFGDLTGDDAAVHIGARALRYLTRARHGMASVPPDHWALIATGELLAARELEDREALIDHARQICEVLVVRKKVHPPGSDLHGAFGPFGRTTPTATRLEGLIAALSYLDPVGDAGLIAQITEAVDEGIDFLLRAQIRQGTYAGAVPRAIRRRLDEPGDSKFNLRATEVRIDYVQHAMSAWMAYLR